MFRADQIFGWAEIGANRLFSGLGSSATMFLKLTSCSLGLILVQRTTHRSQRHSINEDSFGGITRFLHARVSTSDQTAAHQLSARKSSLSEGATGTALASRKTRVEEKKHRMKVGEIMTRDVCLASPSQTLREAAAEMEKCDIGALPVSDNDRLVGMITDRDIAVRGISHGLGPEAPVRDVMSAEVKYCFEEDDIDNLAENMASEQIRRLPVLNDKKRLVGIISLGDLATSRDGRATGVALSGISQHGGHHCQSAAG